MNYKEYSGQLNAKGLKIGIVISRFNDLFTGQLLKGALDCLARHGADEKNVEVVWVPGAFEQPLAVKKLAQTKKFNAVLALGAIIQGATPHAGLIGTQVARALTQISLESGVPVVDGIVTAENLDQAIERCGSKSGNRGWLAAQTAIEMASLFQQLP
ncbi:MAG TPA: 6,7-dimethyl-8-ribityllumazine synthase [Kiritimatiellia bacterium]|jgi:6,7-dimethyl-8-ribityllumazine synthase|nr:6,7-dimethyl-8-ribityllumazine synthase [Kiritimatiellia bacterium]HOU58867.1 6,7-dimethyl-8-ribityllumazine synthase [Kiritimatiellia bacterium]HPV46469.1 6,7-dimethyl-8-ribityllumazine synthase [Kiritimatiellia bacterium]HQM22911.1 6,7-dimethyl-8-ribityllumazine synthase [Kiritimatiellia bacterium]